MVICKLDISKVYDSEKNKPLTIDNLSGVDMIEFSNGAYIAIGDDGLLICDKNHKFKKII